MYRKLSADPASLILGIVSLVIVFLGCCCGIFGVVSLILSTVGLVLAINSLKDYNANSQDYSPQSRKNVSIGKILCIIGIILSTIAIIFFVVLIALNKDSSFTKWNNNFDFKSIEREFKKQDSIIKHQNNNLIQTDSTYQDSLELE
jgi:Kef-type K+ transport system membrane component KefB